MLKLSDPKIKSRGQLTIFFSITMVVLISIIAFIVNVGLYVKAKINLQNSVDAAAWSGAAVQSRQLSMIGYLNWEMRNIYKEWMFKYYVLGSMSINGVVNPTSDSMNFTMQSRPVPNAGRDIYNFPSTCIHFAGTTDICKLYELPGLPRFENTNLPGADQTMNTFLDSIVTKKAEDCSRRTQLNYLTLMNWIYGVTGANEGTQLASQAPAVAGEFAGAWPRAFELAVRIRNLEVILNTHDIDGKDFNQGVCTQQSNSRGIRCGIEIDRLMSSGLPHYERTVKAFFSAYRNLGNEEDDEMKGSFTLTEITPTAYRDPNEYGLSNLLIAKDSMRQKYYVDLKLIPLNLINFYTAFVSTDEKNPNAEGATTAEASCGATKIGIPIPGYPFGYTKNPDVITYYAVKGEANFIGLFNPFQTTYTKLTAYAAAKPFGGRVGPALFSTSSRGETTAVKGRNQPPKTAAYMFGLNLADDNFEPGKPIPLEDSFWVNKPEQTIGGWIPEGEIRFGLPNMIYEDLGDGEAQMGTSAIMTINPGSGETQSLGLFSAAQFKEFKRNFPEYDGNQAITAQAINKAILNVRAPTRYEAQNYLIPYPNELWPQLQVDSFGLISSREENGLWRMQVAAPLFHSSGMYIYNNAAEMKQLLQTYLTAQIPAINSYTSSLQNVAMNMRVGKEAGGLYFKAADVINDQYNDRPLTCNSIAGQFRYYVLGGQSGVDATKCPTPFPESLEKSWANKQESSQYTDKYEITFKYRDSGSTTPINFFTAYSPGPFNNASTSAQVSNPILGGASETMRRNFYSTKFVTLKSLTQNGTYNEKNSNFPIMSEGEAGVKDDTAQNIFANYLDLGSAGVEIDRIFH
jgi:hypothetical protein